MNRILIVFWVLSVFAASGCKKDENTPPPTPAPTVNFTFSPSTGGTAPATIMFLLEYSNATSFVWDFGDGNTSTSQNPSNTYTSAGTYTVRLTGTGPGGTASVTKIVTIGTSPPPPPVPLALFTVIGGSGFAPEVVTFNNISLDATSYIWDFGDGTTSTLRNPIKAFLVGGTFVIRLTAIGPGGTNSFSTIKSIRNTPTQMLLRSFTIRNMPFVDSGGSSFDLSDGPDVFFKLLNASGTVLQTSTTTNNVTQAQLPIGWTFTAPYSITNLSSQYTLSLLDYDGISANDQIRNLTFIPSNLDPDITTQITWSGTNLSAEMEVEFR